MENTFNPASDLLAVVPGGSNTDIIVSPTHLVGPGELAWGGRLRIGPGGKSRNVAQMMAAWLGPGRVAFLGRTLSPPAGLQALAGRISAAAGPQPAGEAATVDDLLPTIYALLAQVPMAALEQAGVVTRYVQRSDYTGTAAGTALIPVDVSGENTIYVAPGLNDDFSPQDVQAAAPLVAAMAQQATRSNRRAVMALALEIRLETAVAAATLARRHGLLVVLDTGGLQDGVNYADLLRLADVVKPNQHEARMLTGVTVSDAASAARAAAVMADKFGLQQVLITAGADGAYLCDSHAQPVAAQHYPARLAGPAVDTTGCGDQFMAVLCAELALGRTLPEAIAPAITAAGLQATRSGIQPVSATV